MKEKKMSSKDFVDALQKGNNLGAEDAFKSAMQDKVGDALRNKKKRSCKYFCKNSKRTEEDDEEV